MISSNYEVEGQLTIFDVYGPAVWPGRTYPEAIGMAVSSRKRTRSRKMKPERQEDRAKKRKSL